MILLTAFFLLQVTPERLREAATKEPHNWLTYNGSYASTHHSLLSELNPGNVKNLQLQWAWQSNSPDKIQAAPLVVDGVMYLTDPPNDVVAEMRAVGLYVYTALPPTLMLRFCVNDATEVPGRPSSLSNCRSGGENTLFF